MNNFVIGYMSLLIFLPAIGALVLSLFPARRPELIKLIAFGFTAMVFLMTLWMAVPDVSSASDTVRFSFDPETREAVAQMQHAFSLGWIPSFNIYYFLGMDGISFPLLILTSFVSMLAMGASWTIDRHVKAYCILFLLLETGMLGVFLALDFFLFYVFWEVCLVAMYFLIGIWGHERRIYAAVKFFLYTMAGSVLMLAAIIYLYNRSGTFDYPALLGMMRSGGLRLSGPEQLLLFLAFFLAGFAGSALVPNQVLTPGLGNHFIIQAFAVVIVGGLGSVRGTFVAAMLLGLAESIGSLLMPSISLYVCMILILQARASFALQLPSFLVFILGGAIALIGALAQRNQAPALYLASSILPFATFYAITTFLLGQMFEVCVAVTAAYGFTIIAMLIPAVSEFDVALSEGSANRG